MTPPTKMVEDDETKKTKDVVKKRSEGDEAEKKSAQVNAKALNTIFAGVDKKRFKLISTCTSIKNAWDIIQTVQESTSTAGSLSYK